MISILLAVFNGGHTIKKTLKSIYNQTYKDWELIVVDDGSFDNTMAILAQAKKQYPGKIHIFKNKKNIGLTKSLIRAAKKARGEYLTRIDSGDLFLSEKLGKQVRFLSENKDYGIVGCNGVTFFDTLGKIGKRTCFPLTNKEIKKTILKKNPFVHSAIMMRREIYEKAGGYNSKIPFAQDYDLWFRVLQLGKAANLKWVGVHRFMDSNSISYKNQNAQMKCVLKIKWKHIKKWKFLEYHVLLEPLGVLLTPLWIKKIIRSKL